MRTALFGLFAAFFVSGAVAACSSAPKPPPCQQCAPWTPGPIHSPSSAGSASAATSSSAVSEAPEAPPLYSIEQLLKVHRAMSPRALDAKTFVYLSDEPGTAQLFAKQGDKPRQLTSFPDRVSNFRVAPGSKELVFLKDSGGDENDQIYRLDIAKGESTQLTGDPKVKHTLPVFDGAGKHIAFTSNARNGKDMDLVVQAWPGAAWTEKSKEAKPTIELAGNWFVTDFRGDQALALEVRSNVDQDVWLVDVNKKTKKLLTKHEGDAIYEGARFSRDGKAVFVVTNIGKEFNGLQWIDVATGKGEWLVSEEHDLLGLSVPRWNGPAKKDGPEDLLSFGVNVDGVEKLAIVTIDKKRKVQKRLDPKAEGVIGTIDFEPGGSALYLSNDRSTTPSEVYRVAVDSGEITRETVSDHAGVIESTLVPDQLLSYETYDKKKISYFWWSAPGGPSKKPVIIEVHGGPESQSQPYFSAVRQYLALSGYSVASPNVRGSIGYGKSFAHLDDKEKREDSVHDLSELGKVLAQRADVDPKKIALYGGSYGGYMVLAGLTLYPEQWAAGVDIVGIANFRTFLEQTAAYRRALREAEYGSLSMDGPLLDRISPIHKVDKIVAPLMVIHGTRDPRVPIGEAKQMAAALEKRGTPVVLMTFEDEGHGLAKLKNRLIAYPAMVKFLDQHVKHRK
ncbi:MAG: prolyl oligopeptidase family serine peptidase [Polyangiales bacterium]